MHSLVNTIVIVKYLHSVTEHSEQIKLQEFVLLDLNPIDIFKEAIFIYMFDCLLCFIDDHAKHSLKDHPLLYRN